jgi:hypothetical protein
MPRKTLYIILAIVLVILGGLGWYFFGRTPAVTEPVGTDTENPDLFPFGSGASDGSVGGGTVKPRGGAGGSTVIDLSGGSQGTQPRLRKLSDDQVSGAGIFSKGEVTIVHYMDRATGHIFEMNVDTMAKNKISNITMPQIYETLWSSDGSELVARYLKDDGETIQSFYGRLPATTTISSSLEGYFLPSNIREISLAGNNIIYLDPTVDGALTTSLIDGTKKSFVTNLYSEDWSLGLANSKQALVGARPSGIVPGDLYTLDMTTGVKSNFMSDIAGLTGLMSPDGLFVLASASEGRGIASAVYSIKDRKISTLSLSTLSDKCAWSRAEKDIVYCAVPTAVPSGTYPDDWYQGMVSFEDRIWRIDAVNDETDLVLDPSIEVGIDMDMTNLGTDTSGTHLIFTNRDDASLWVLDLK